MAKLEVKKTVVSGEAPVWVNVTETTLGGFVLDTATLTKGETLKAGTAMTFDEEARVAKADQEAPKGLLYSDVVIDDNTSVDVVLRGTVYENRIPAITDDLKKLMPTILFSKSK